MGRPRTQESIRDLIVKIGRETGWGYTRVMGELKKLGVKPPSRNTVKRIMKEHGIEPAPDRGPDSWSEFLLRHADTLVQCDFFSKRIWTRFGLKQCFVLVFIHVGSRRVFISTSTQKPTAVWMEEQAANFIEHARANDLKVAILMRDRDSNYRDSFDAAFKARDIKIHQHRYRSPNLNAFVERFIQSIQHEALDHFVVFGEKHFDYLVSQYVEHYLTERPHQAKENELLIGERAEIGDEPPDPRTLVCRKRLGGMLKHYERRAA
jgi:putative transposase